MVNRSHLRAERGSEFVVMSGNMMNVDFYFDLFGKQNGKISMSKCEQSCFCFVEL